MTCPGDLTWFGQDCAPCHTTCQGTVSCECRKEVCACPRSKPIQASKTRCIVAEQCNNGYEVCRYRAVKNGRLMPDVDIHPREEFTLICDKDHTVKGAR
eukprot:sb/3478692/